MDITTIYGIYTWNMEALYDLENTGQNETVSGNIHFSQYADGVTYNSITFHWDNDKHLHILYDSDEIYNYNDGMSAEAETINFGLQGQDVDFETFWAELVFNSLNDDNAYVSRTFKYIEGVTIQVSRYVVGTVQNYTPRVVIPPYKVIRGWSKYNDDFVAYDFTQPIRGDETLYVYFRQGPQSVVTINVDGVETTQVVNTGTKATQPSSPTKEGYTFLGWSYSPDNFVYFDFDNVTIFSNITVYAYFNIDSFSITIYQNLSDSEVVNKDIQRLGVVLGYLRESTSITNLSFRIEQEQPPQFNYIYVEIFNRYYYVTNIYSIVTGVWGIETSIDVLMTYKDLIKRQTAYVTRQEFLTNPDVIDDITSYEQEPIILTQKIDTTPFETDTDTNSTHCYVINVVRRNV